MVYNLYCDYKKNVNSQGPLIPNTHLSFVTFFNNMCYFFANYLLLRCKKVNIFLFPQNR